MRRRVAGQFLCLVLLLAACELCAAAPAALPEPPSFPLSLEAYGDSAQTSIFEILRLRIAADPFNLVATLIFLLAIVHTFLATKFMHLAHKWRDEHRTEIEAAGLTAEAKPQGDAHADVSFKAEIMHFLGEVEAIFGIWVIPLLAAITLFKGWPAAERYLSQGVIFTEPMFVVVVMCIAATRPVLRFAEQCLSVVAGLGKRTPAAWWLSILTVGPVLGSLITEPAAMIICALLLARQFYDLNPSLKFRYATLGLLFVNISVGGTFTHFAAPPVLMVAAKWNWDIAYMFTHFGWKALIGIVLANAIYFAIFRREFSDLQPSANADEQP